MNTQRIVFFNIAWMDRYAGICDGDFPLGGGSWVAEHGYGHEILNFKPFKGSCYGFVQPAGPTLNIDRLGAPKGAPFVDGVTVVWTAPSPQGGTYVVGWYRDARVFREIQHPPKGSGRKHAGAHLGFLATATKANVQLFLSGERTIRVPRGGLGKDGKSRSGMGMKNVWYAESHPFATRALEYVSGVRGIPAPSKPATPKGGGGWQLDPKLRKAIEKAAEAAVEKLFRDKLKYSLLGVQSLARGWDYEATLGSERLLLEVKGRQGTDVGAELTPNEWAQANSKMNASAYRICIVTNALTDPKVRVFRRVSTGSSKVAWFDGQVELTVQELRGARVFV